jgi:hypothetical protein
VRDTADAFKREVFGERSFFRSSETATDTNTGVKRLPTLLVLLSKNEEKAYSLGRRGSVPEKTVQKRSDFNFEVQQSFCRFAPAGRDVYSRAVLFLIFKLRRSAIDSSKQVFPEGLAPKGATIA